MTGGSSLGLAEMHDGVFLKQDQPRLGEVYPQRPEEQLQRDHPEQGQLVFEEQSDPTQHLISLAGGCYAAAVTTDSPTQ